LGLIVGARGFGAVVGVAAGRKFNPYAFIGDSRGADNG
jgi:hypothetical protein